MKTTLTTLCTLLTTLLISSPSHGVIYGDDDRQEVSTSLSKIESRVNRATAVMIKNENLLSFIFASERHNLCSSERFSSQNTIGECTAFLIAPDTMMTAGHCLYIDGNNYKTICDNVSFAFDYIQGEDNFNQVVECESVPFVRYDPEEGADYAIVKLKSSVIDREPLKLKHEVKLNDQVFSVGSGLGLPKKISRNGKIKIVAKKHIDYDLDLLGGNSGGPIALVKTGEVVGVHIYGSPFELDNNEASGCKTYNRDCTSENGLCDFAGAYPVKDMAPYMFTNAGITTK